LAQTAFILNLGVLHLFPGVQYAKYTTNAKSQAQHKVTCAATCNAVADVVTLEP
jgi:hypothetical protein